MLGAHGVAPCLESLQGGSKVVRSASQCLQQPAGADDRVDHLGSLGEFLGRHGVTTGLEVRACLAGVLQDLHGGQNVGRGSLGLDRYGLERGGRPAPSLGIPAGVPRSCSGASRRLGGSRRSFADGVVSWLWQVFPLSRRKTAQLVLGPPLLRELGPAETTRSGAPMTWIGARATCRSTDYIGSPGSDRVQRSLDWIPQDRGSQQGRGLVTAQSPA